MSGLRWGLQLPIQSKSPTFVQPWELECGGLELASIAVAADTAGADYIAVCDHIAVPVDRVESIGGTWFDTVATLAWLGAQTTSVRLMSHVYVLGYRSPYVTAKQFATLDELTGGRALLGVGAGHVRGEFELLGASFENRGRDLDAAIGHIRSLWRDGGDAHAVIEPTSPRPDGPPILVGGSSGPALRRAAAIGDGWLPQGVPERGFRAAVDELRAAVAERSAVSTHPFEVHVHLEPVRIADDPGDEPNSQIAGRGVFVGTADQVAERIGRYRAIGADVHQARFAALSAADYCDQIARFSDVVSLIG